jgi:hypothetical protein
LHHPPKKRPATATRCDARLTRASKLKAGVRVGIEEVERGEFADMAPVETEHYLETGDLPERVARWLDSYDSPRAT